MYNRILLSVRLTLFASYVRQYFHEVEILIDDRSQKIDDFYTSGSRRGPTLAPLHN